jgi:hypothetical protein
LSDQRMAGDSAWSRLFIERARKNAPCLAADATTAHTTQRGVKPERQGLEDEMTTAMKRSRGGERSIHCIADLPFPRRSGSKRSTTTVEQGDWQVFGLAGFLVRGCCPTIQGPTGRGFPTRVQSNQCQGAAFVPAYRCWAVPDSNRVPS